MSYIRTKDGIYKVESETYNKQGYYIDRYEEDVILKKQVIIQSESLEELCDEGVIEVKFGSTGYITHFKKYIYDLKKFLKYLEECQPITKDEILNVYGAIWIDGKGLVYVAKMNDKGELELI